MQRHVSTHDPNRAIYNCEAPLCNDTFRGEQAYRKHINAKHPLMYKQKYDKLPYRFHCNCPARGNKPACNVVTPYRQAMKIHLKEQHDDCAPLGPFVMLNVTFDPSVGHLDASGLSRYAMPLGLPHAYWSQSAQRHLRHPAAEASNVGAAVLPAHVRRESLGAALLYSPLFNVRGLGPSRDYVKREWLSYAAASSSSQRATSSPGCSYAGNCESEQGAPSRLLPSSPLQRLTTSRAWGVALLSTLDGGYMSTSNLCNVVAASAQRVGLPSGGFHAFRRDVAKQITIALGADLARLVLNHDQERNTLHRHYTGGVSMLNVMGVRSGEAITEEGRRALDQARYFAERLEGIGMRAMAQHGVAEAPQHPKQRRYQSHDIPSETERAVLLCETSETLPAHIAAFEAGVARVMDAVRKAVKVDEDKLRPYSDQSQRILGRIVKARAARGVGRRRS